MCVHAYIHINHICAHMLNITVRGAFSLMLLSFWCKPELLFKVNAALSIGRGGIWDFSVVLGYGRFGWSFCLPFFLSFFLSSFLLLELSLAEICDLKRKKKS